MLVLVRGTWQDPVFDIARVGFTVSIWPEADTLGVGPAGPEADSKGVPDGG